MTPVLGRRHFMGGALAAGALGAGRAGALSPWPARSPVWEGKFEKLQADGRLGVALVSRNGLQLWWRQDEHFAFCSSFKLSLAALILSGAGKGHWRLDEKVAFGKGDLLANSPVTSAHLQDGSMSVSALAEAAQKFSDNAATNLLLKHIGGLQSVNGFWRYLGDSVSRLDDYEMALNRVPPGSVRNTTTPAAMASNLYRMFGQGWLLPPVAAQLKTWMHDTTTGAKRLRAGLPADWWAGDKTGTGLPADIPGTYVDLAWVEPPKLPPFAIAAFYQPPRPTPDGDSNAEEVLAQVGRIVAQAIVLQGK